MITPILLSFVLINFLLIKNFNFLSKKIKVADRNSTQKVPLFGGVYLMLNTFIYFLLLYFNFFSDDQIIKINFFFIFLITIFFLVGLFDDKFNLPPSLRFFILCSSLFLFLYSNDEFLIKEIHFFLFNDKKISNIYLENFYIQMIFTIFCIFAFLNALNFFDGINLQVPIYSSVILIYLFLIENHSILLIYTICLLFFMYLNFYNKAYLGDSGVYIISIIISLHLINYSNKTLINADEILFLLLLPGLDMIRVFLDRIFKKKNPFKGDQNHLHHLVKKKFNKNYLYVMLAASLSPIIFYNHLTISKIFLFLILLFCYFALLIYLKKNEFK